MRNLVRIIYDDAESSKSSVVTIDDSCKTR